MFGNLFGTARKFGGVANRSPEELAAIMLAYDRLSDHGEILIDDGFLEARVAEQLLALDDVRHVAMFGFSNHLRLLVEAVVHGQRVEVTYSITPTEVIWDDPYTMAFEVETLEVKPVGAATQVSIMAIKEAVAILVPLGGVVCALGTAAVAGAARAAALSRVSSALVESDRGVTRDGATFVVDLQAQPELAPLFVSAQGVAGANLLEAMGVGAPKVVDHLKVSGLRACRQGLVVGVELSAMASAALKATVAATKSARAVASVASD